MAISKVVYGDDTLIDITDSTVSANNMLNGTVGYDSAGVRTVGTVAVTDEKVKQTPDTSNSDLRVLLSNSANDTEETNISKKSTNLKFNPSTGNLQTTKINGETVGNSPKFTDTHRPININGTQLLGNNATAVNFKNGSNVTITGSGANVTIAATDTTYTATKENIGSASAGTAIAADDITAWTTNTPTVVTKKTVVTGGTTTDIPNISKKTVVTGVTKKTVVTSASGATASYANGILTITDGSFSTGDSVTVSTGDSVTVGTAIKAYTSLTTGDSVSVTPGTAASLSYTARSIPNISVTSKSVVTEVTAN